MTVTTAGPHAPGGRLRIAISSPEILNRIRHVFTSSGLQVEFDGPLSIEVVVSPGPGPSPAAGALRAALGRLVRHGSAPEPPGTARYRLAVVPSGPLRSLPAGDAPGARSTTPAPRPVALPAAGPTEPAADAGALLSPREADVMSWINRGLSNADIAGVLRLRRKTVKNHINHIFAKLGARSRVEAVLIWRRMSREAAGPLGPAGALGTAGAIAPAGRADRRLADGGGRDAATVRSSAS